MVEKGDYKELMDKVGKKEFSSRLSQLMQSAKEFISESGFEETVYCNKRILSQVLLDYYSDIYRLKDFHDIERVRTEKILAYTISWIIKRKPLQFKDDFLKEEKDIFVNERFAAYLMLNECLCCGKYIVPLEHREDLDRYIDLLFYYFKYRECNSQVLELVISSFKMGEFAKKA